MHRTEMLAGESHAANEGVVEEVADADCADTDSDGCASETFSAAEELFPDDCLGEAPNAAEMAEANPQQSSQHVVMNMI